MPEDIFATWQPALSGAMEQGREASVQSMEDMKNAPLKDLARQVQTEKLKSELQDSPTIQKLIGGMAGQQAPRTPAPPAQPGQPGATGPAGTPVPPQAPTPPSPLEAYQTQITRFSDVLTKGIEAERDGKLSPEGLQKLFNSLTPMYEAAQKQYEVQSGPMMNIMKSITPEKYEPESIQKFYDNFKSTGRPDYSLLDRIEKPEKTIPLAERTFEDWLKLNPTVKDAKTGKTRAANAADYDEYKRLLVTKEKKAEQMDQDKAVAQEIIAGNADIGPVTGRNKGIIAEIRKLDPTFNLKLAHARYTSDTAELTKVKQQRGQISTFEKTAEKNLDIMRGLSNKVDRSGTPVINRWILAGKKGIKGDPDVAAFEAAMTTFAGEYAKIMTSATGSGVTSNEAREEIHRIINTAMTQGQISEVSDILHREMGNRISSFDEQIKTTEDRIGGKKAPANITKEQWDSFEKPKK